MANTVFDEKKKSQHMLQLLQQSIIGTIKRIDRLRDEHLFNKQFAAVAEDSKMMLKFQHNPDDYVSLTEVNGYDNEIIDICKENKIEYAYVDCRDTTTNMSGDIIINREDYDKLMDLVRDHNIKLQQEQDKEENTVDEPTEETDVPKLNDEEKGKNLEEKESEEKGEEETEIPKNDSILNGEEVTETDKPDKTDKDDNIFPGDGDTENTEESPETEGKEETGDKEGSEDKEETENKEGTSEESDSIVPGEEEEEGKEDSEDKDTEKKGEDKGEGVPDETVNSDEETGEGIVPAPEEDEGNSAKSEESDKSETDETVEDNGTEHGDEEEPENKDKQEDATPESSQEETAPETEGESQNQAPAEAEEATPATVEEEPQQTEAPAENPASSEEDQNAATDNGDTSSSDDQTGSADTGSDNDSGSTDTTTQTSSDGGSGDADNGTEESSGSTAETAASSNEGAQNTVTENTVDKETTSTETKETSSDNAGGNNVDTGNTGNSGGNTDNTTETVAKEKNTGGSDSGGGPGINEGPQKQSEPEKKDEPQAAPGFVPAPNGPENPIYKQFEGQKTVGKSAEAEIYKDQAPAQKFPEPPKDSGPGQSNLSNNALNNNNLQSGGVQNTSSVADASRSVMGGGSQPSSASTGGGGVTNTNTMGLVPPPSGGNESHSLDVNADHFKPARIDNSEGMEKAVVNATGIKDAARTQNYIAGGLREINELQSGGLMDIAGGFGRKAYITDNYKGFMKTMGDKDMALLEKAMGKSLTGTKLENATENIKEISKFTEQIGLSRSRKGQDGYAFLDKMRNTKENNEYVFKVLRSNKNLKGISDKDLKSLANNLIKNQGKLSDLFGQTERLGLLNNAKHMMIAPNGLLIKASRQDPTLAQLERSYRVGHQVNQIRLIVRRWNDIRVDKKLRSLNHDLARKLKQGKETKANLKLKGTLTEKEKALLKRQQDEIKKLTKRRNRVGKKYNKIKSRQAKQAKKIADKKAKQAARKAARDKIVNKAKDKLKKTAIGKAAKRIAKPTRLLAAGAKKVFSPARFLMKQLTALNAFLNKVKMLIGKYALMFLAGYLRFWYKVGIAVIIIVFPLTIIMSFFSPEDDSQTAEPITEAEAVDADGHVISVYGLIYTQLDKEEIEWVTELAANAYTDTDPPYLKEILLSEPDNFREHRNMNPKDYIEQVMNGTYVNEGGYDAIVGPEPFPGAPDEAYKHIRIVDGGHRFEFRDPDGKLGYGSNIKEIVSMTSLVTQLAENTENDYEEDAEDDGGFLDNLANFAKKAWAAIKTLITNGLKALEEAIVPDKLREWWTNHTVANAIYQRAKISMRYAHPLFDASHDVAFSVEWAMAPTLNTMNQDGLIPVDENGSLIGSSVSGSSFTSSEFTSDNTPESPSGTYVEGVPAELYILSISGETGGGEISARLVGDKRSYGYRAQGIIQMDAAYNIGNFAAFGIKRHPDVWSGYAAYQGQSKVHWIQKGDDLYNAMVHALQTDFTAATEDEVAHCKTQYYDGPYKTLLAAGVDLKDHSVYVGAALLSVNNNTGVKKRYTNAIINGVKSGKTDAQIISAIYAERRAIKNDSRWTTEEKLALKMLRNELTINDKWSSGATTLNGNPFILTPEREKAINDAANGLSVSTTYNGPYESGGTAGTSYETITVGYGNICNGNIKQVSPIENTTHNQGCMSFDKFSYDDVHNAGLMFYNGSECPTVTPGYMVDTGYACVAPNIKTDFVNAYNNNTGCWKVSSEPFNETGHNSGQFKENYPTACSEGSFGYNIYGNSQEVKVKVFETHSGSYDSDTGTDTRETDGTIYTFTHECAGDHTGYYCGGHLRLVIIGVVAGFTEPEKKFDTDGYTDRSDKFKVSNTYNAVDIDKEALEAAVDIFDVDNAITHPAGVVSKVFEGWNKQNIEWCVSHRGDDEDWKQTYNIDSNKKLEDILGSSGYAAFLGGGTASVQNCTIPNIDNGWVDEGALPVMYFCQNASGGGEWASASIGGKSTIAAGGCGYTSMAMACTYLRAGTDKNSDGVITPAGILQVIAQHNGGDSGALHVAGSGASHSMPQKVAGYLGLACEYINGDNSVNTKTKLIEALKNGNPVVMNCHGRKSGENSNSTNKFTKKGHFILVTGYCDTNGMFTVNDPSHPDNSNERYTFEFLANENNRGEWWIISDPNDTASQFTHSDTTEESKDKDKDSKETEETKATETTKAAEAA